MSIISSMRKGFLFLVVSATPGWTAEREEMLFPMDEDIPMISAMSRSGEFNRFSPESDSFSWTPILSEGSPQSMTAESYSFSAETSLTPLEYAYILIYNENVELHRQGKQNEVPLRLYAAYPDLCAACFYRNDYSLLKLIERQIESGSLLRLPDSIFTKLKPTLN